MTAKDTSRISLSPGGSGSHTVSCINKGSVGGTFSNGDPSHQPQWYDDGYLGAGHPYFWFTGQSQIKVLNGSSPSDAYIDGDAYTVYIVMYAHVLESTNTVSLSQNATAITFSAGNTGLAVRAGDGGMATAYNLEPHPLYDYVEAPITAGDATLHVWKLEHSGGVLSISVDGGAPFTAPSGDTHTLGGTPAIGFDGRSFNRGSFYGAVCEWIVYDTAVSPHVHAMNMAYLRNEWGTP